MKESKGKLTLDQVDRILKNVKGNSYRKLYCAVNYLKYSMGEKVLSVFLAEASQEELEDAYALLTKVMDGGLQLRKYPNLSLLVVFCASRIAEKLNDMGVECTELKPFKEVLSKEI